MLITKLRKPLALVLVFLMFFSMVPFGYAAEMPSSQFESGVDPPTEESLPEDDVSLTEPTITSSESDSDSVPEDTIPETESAPETESTEPSEEDVPQDGPGIMGLSPGDSSTWAIGSTQKSIMLFDYADNGNYTTVLNSQVACAYKPNGSGTTRTAYIKNLGWHFARYGGVAYADDPLYCIEPWRSYAASTSGNSVDRDVTLDGSGSTTGSNVWYALPAARREAIGLILLYSNQMWNHSISVTTTSKANNPNVPLRIATQFLIYEIVCGLRDPNTFTLNSTNECGTAGNIFYNAGAASVTNFTSNYNTLVFNIQAAKKIPSFTSSSSGSAPTINLTGEETSVYDSNGVLSNFSFTDGNGAEFYKSGSTLYITQTGTISSSTVYRATRYLPSAASSTYNIWYMSGSSYQTTVSLASASSGSLNAYFKLKAPDPGTISLTKTTEGGQNLSGWRFGVYTNSACTSLAAGPYTTNSNGKISITGLTAGTYYVKELGHTDSSINAMYYCSSTNPQKVSITSGGTTSVSFYNKLNTGSISLTKTTEDGQNLSGWQFGVYSNSACTALVSGPHTTNTSGKISITGLTAGTYYVKELGHTDSSIQSRYTCASINPQKVTVTSGGTASVSFHNKLNTGSLKLVKITSTGENVSGWKIGVYADASCTQAVAGSPFTTGADGTVTVPGLAPGTYYAKELPTDDPYWVIDTAVKPVTVTVGQTAEVSFTNTHLGCIEIEKTTNTGNFLGGWTFRVQDSDGKVIGEYTTDETGYACTENLTPGRYIVLELPTEDPYWTTELGFHDVIVKPGATVVDSWHNKEQGLVWVYKKTNTDDSVEGWQITIYSDQGCTQEVGSITTNAEGKAGLYLEPGTYWAKETGDEHGRFEDEYWMVDESIQKFEIHPHADTEITFTNVQYGKLKIIKTVEGDGNVEGWQFQIANADGEVLEGSPFTTDQDGIILTENLLPGEYTVEELLPEGSLYECKSDNPQPVTVTRGETAEVTFVNGLRPGNITLEKVDITGSPLAGATFCLEWSDDGLQWQPVTYSETTVQGSCSNPNVTEGNLTTAADGILKWDNLYPGLYYRLTEVQAPEGYNLLEGPAFEGELSTDNLSIGLQVVNTRTFTLPETGATGIRFFPLFTLIPTSVCASGLVFSILRKRRL